MLLYFPLKLLTLCWCECAQELVAEAVTLGVAGAVPVDAEWARTTKETAETREGGLQRDLSVATASVINESVRVRTITPPSTQHSVSHLLNKMFPPVTPERTQPNGGVL